MVEKTHKSAVAIIPQDEIWEPIQNIRKAYDKNFDRWMPHINILYPFYPQKEFSLKTNHITQITDGIAPFKIQLNSFNYFIHTQKKITIWLSPEPLSKLQALQNSLQGIFPECYELSKFKKGFTPHLSVGEVGSEKEAIQIISELEKTWIPIDFHCKQIHIIERLKNTPFRIKHSFELNIL
jgi:2'-5' RNA ligase